MRVAGFARHQPELRAARAARLVEVFGYDRGAGNRRHAFFHQDRRGSGRIEHQKFLAPLPHPLLDQPRRQAELLEHKAHETRMRTEGMMKQRQHASRARGKM